MADKIYPKGISVFSPRQGAPDFVKGTVVITVADLMAWVNENKQHLSDYNGKAQLKLDLLSGEKGLYVSVNTFKPTGTKQEKQSTKVSEDLPF